jgi:hypothetical protein
LAVQRWRVRLLPYRLPDFELQAELAVADSLRQRQLELTVVRLLYQPHQATFLHNQVESVQLQLLTLQITDVMASRFPKLACTFMVVLVVLQLTGTATGGGLVQSSGGHGDIGSGGGGMGGALTGSSAGTVSRGGAGLVIFYCY